MKRFGLFALLFLLGCTFNSGAAQEVSAPHAEQLFKQGSYKDALAMFNAMLAKNGGDEQAQRGLVNVLVETGDYAQAESKANAFLGARPADAAIRSALAEARYQTGRYGDAAAEFARASRDAKGAVMCRAVLGQARALLAQGKTDEAQTVAQQLLRYYTDSAPHSAEELTPIAEGLVLLEKYKDANELFIDAREADPTYAEALIAQGELLNEKYSYGDALSLFEDALKINPNSPRALLGLAECKQNGSVSSSRQKSAVAIANEEPPAVVAHTLSVNANLADAHAMDAWLALET